MLFGVFKCVLYDCRSNRNSVAKQQLSQLDF